jgi:RNA polymerase sigma factor (sigma-70 family)
MAMSEMSEGLQPDRARAESTDAQLLEEYISRRDQAALATLVERHGPMVWGVCRRLLREYHDAEDAFQATFLVFVRKAASIASRELLANWLYGVACQTALKLRSTTARQRQRERPVTTMPEPAVSEQELWHHLQPFLDQELNRLPSKYRAAVVLCDLEGKTRKEAAHQLGLAEGTVASRLARARGMLAKRLTRHGLAVSSGALGVVLSQSAASAAVPTCVVANAIQAASLYGAGQAAAGAGLSTKVVALAQGVLKSMLLSKLKMALGVVLLAVVVYGVGVEMHTAAPEQSGSTTATANSANPPQKGLHDHVKAHVGQLHKLVKSHFHGQDSDGD